jgi:hypothetical protein
MRHFPLRELGYAIAFLVLLAAIYVGAYYAMVGQGEMAGFPGSDEVTFPMYPVWQQQSEWFFSLAHELDKSLRPEFWHVK